MITRWSLQEFVGEVRPHESRAAGYEADWLWHFPPSQLRLHCETTAPMATKDCSSRVALAVLSVPACEDTARNDVPSLSLKYGTLAAVQPFSAVVEHRNV
jgi:hypothetical protein